MRIMGACLRVFGIGCGFVVFQGKSGTFREESGGERDARQFAYSNVDGFCVTHLGAAIFTVEFLSGRITMVSRIRARWKDQSSALDHALNVAPLPRLHAVRLALNLRDCQQAYGREDRRHGEIGPQLTQKCHNSPFARRIHIAIAGKIGDLLRCQHAVSFDQTRPAVNLDSHSAMILNEIFPLVTSVVPFAPRVGGIVRNQDQANRPYLP